MKMLLSYLRSHLKIICLFAVFAAIFAAVFFLYSLPSGALAYAMLLCFAAALVFAGADYYKYRKKRRTLEGILNNITVASELLPEPSRGTETDYTEIIRQLNRRILDFARFSADSMRERDEYYTMWVHQVKTPIAAMRLILNDEDTPLGQEISAQLFTIERYVDMALVYVRTESESTDYLFKKYNIDAIVRRAVRKYAPIFIHKKLNVDFTPTGLEVLTDEKWLGFVIEQLLSNAVKYTHSGQVSIFIQGDDTLVIKDTGIGIAPEDLPRICEEGFTGHNGREDKRASGIGLYLSKKVMRQLGHTLCFESTPGEGTTVYLGLHTDKTLFD